VALALAILAAAPRGRRARVLLPAWGCYDLMTAADSADAEVLLYDLDPATLTPDRESFEAALRRGADAAVIVHWFGLPVDLAPFQASAGRAGALLIDDAAQAAGATIGSQPAGSTGDFGILSFGRGKGRTGGSGGALLARTSEAQERMSAVDTLPGNPRAPLTAVRLGVQWLLGRPRLFWIPHLLPGSGLGETVYRPVPLLRSMALEAAAALERNWGVSMDEVKTRQGNADRWARLLARVPGITTISPAANSNPSWLRYPVLATGTARERLSGPRARRSGVMPGYPRKLEELPVRPGRIGFAPKESPGASRLTASLYTLPTHQWTGHRDFDAVAGMLQE
jgi:dTDP-4-amino-4,6-dideoxygalactose transaminase